MKILLVNKFFYRRGGAEVVFFNTAGLLRRDGHEIVEFSMKHPENETSRFEASFTDHVDYPTLSGPVRMTRQALRAIYSRHAYRRILAVARRERPDVAHLHNYYFHLSPSILYALRKAGVPVIHTLHDYHLFCPNHIFYDYRRESICEDCPEYGFRSVLTNGCMKVGRVRSVVGFVEAVLYHWLGTYARLVDHYIAPSEFLRSKLSPRPVPMDKISVLSNPVEDYGEPSPPASGGVFFYAGRLSREKGLDMILELAERLPQTRWRLAGTGPMEKDLRQAIETRAGANIELLGALAGEALQDAYRDATAVVLPSRCFENCPLTVLEAMSSGRPTIGTRLGGIAELVRDGETGWLFAPGSVNAFEGVVRKVVDAPDEVVRAGEAARRVFVERHAPRLHLRGLLGIYEQAVKQATSSAQPGG